MSALGSTAIDRLSRLASGGETPRTTAGKRQLPNVEHLEKLLLLSTCPVISGFVFLDQNANPALTNNGLFDPGELSIPNAQVELFDSSGHLLATTHTDASGAYSFMTTPIPGAQPVTSAAQTLTLPATLTNFSNVPFSQALHLFDPMLGTLTGVTITRAASFNSTINSQNVSPTSGASITGRLSGTYQLNGLSQLISGSVQSSQGPVAASPFDPLNPNANKIPPFVLNATDAPGSVTLTDAASLAYFTGSASRTTVTPTMSATGLGTATSPNGNLNNTAVTSAGGVVTVTYTYIPAKCLTPGNYVLVQTPNPPNLINGKESQPGHIFPPPTDDFPQTLAVTVTPTDNVLPNNDFAKLSAGNPNNNQCPTVGSLVRYGVHHQPTQLVLTFIGPVNPTMANNPNNYYVTTSTGAHVKIKSATFNPTTNSVTLIPLRPLNVHLHYDLTVMLPCSGPCNTVVVPFGGKQSLGGFTNHRGQFVPVVNGHPVRPTHAVATHAHAAVAHARAVHARHH
jgi:hypothetical protein